MTTNLTCAWVKYARRVTMKEARTQNEVARIVNAVPATAVLVPKVYCAFVENGFGYVVMEYIDGSDSAVNDAAMVASAVQQLTIIRVPSTTPPGPVGGGRIIHRFFFEWRSAVIYPSVKLLQEHINNILRSVPVRARVNFKDEIQDGLTLCLCDVKTPGTFRITGNGQVVALDFEAHLFSSSLVPGFRDG